MGTHTILSKLKNILAGSVSQRPSVSLSDSYCSLGRVSACVSLSAYEPILATSDDAWSNLFTPGKDDDRRAASFKEHPQSVNLIFGSNTISEAKSLVGALPQKGLITVF